MDLMISLGNQQSYFQHNLQIFKPYDLLDVKLTITFMKVCGNQMTTKEFQSSETNIILDDFGWLLSYKYYIKIQGSNLHDYISSHLLTRILNLHTIILNPVFQENESIRIYVEFQLKTEVIRKEMFIKQK